MAPTALPRRLLLGSALSTPFLKAARAAGRPSTARIHAAIARTDALAQQLLETSGIPGLAIAIVQGDALRFARGYGVRKIDEAGLVDADTVFQLASVSKPLGATVVAHQVGQGSVSWDSRMRQLLPWFTLSDAAATQALTVADLYAHRSGLPDHAGDILEDIGFDQDAILHRLRLVPIEGFRKTYRYTNAGLTAAAVGVAAQAGTDWASLSDSVLYQPLGMNRTTSRYGIFMAQSNRAVGHVPVDGRFVPGPPRDADAQSPAGGASSSVKDVAKWLSLILGVGRYEGRQIIPRDGLIPALSPQMQTAPAHDGKPASFYGFGFNVGTSDGGYRSLGHSGAFLLGAGTSIMLLPELDVGIVVLTNAWPLGVAEAVSLTFLDYVQFGAPQRDWMAVVSPFFAQMTAPEGSLAGKTPPPDAPPPQPLAAYAGAYDNPYYGPVTVSAVQDGLMLTAGPGHVTMPLRHWSGDRFALRPSGENAPPGSLYPLDFQGQPPERFTTPFFAESIDKTFAG